MAGLIDAKGARPQGRDRNVYEHGKKGDAEDGGRGLGEGVGDVVTMFAPLARDTGDVTAVFDNKNSTFSVNT